MSRDYYTIKIYSINNRDEENDIYSENYEDVLAKYEAKVSKLQNYKIISKIELSKGYKHKNTYELLKAIKFNDIMEIEELSHKYNLKLNELFQCVACESSYFTTNESYYDFKSKKYGTDKKEEFLNDYNLANKELEELLQENKQQITIEDEQYNKIKGAYKSLIINFDNCSNDVYFAEVTILNRTEKVKTNYIDPNYNINIIKSTSSNILDKCKSHNYDTLRDKMHERNMPTFTGKGNDIVIILSELEWLDLINECKAIEENIKEEERLQKEKDEIEWQKRKQEAQIWADAFSVISQKKLIYPRGGEEGTDGYYHVVVKNNNTEATFEVILRNVFDVGCWTLIANQPFEHKKTEDEKLACKWVYDHSPFTTSIRM